MKKQILLMFLVLSTWSFTVSSVVRKISVTGNSEREVIPNMAKISFSINTKKNSLSLATKDSNEKLEKFKSDLNKKKINISSLETLSFYSTKTKENISEEEIFRQDSISKVPTSYNINLTFSILNTEFDKISSLINISEDMLKSVKKDYETNSFYFSLNEIDSNADKAMNNIFKKFDIIKRELISQGIQENNIILNNYNIKENYENSKIKEKDVFVVVHNFTLELKDLKKLNELISIADDNSINIEGSIQFDISDKEKIQSEMYNEAFSQSKNKATSILKSSGMTLYSPLVVSEDINFQQKMIDRIDENWQVNSEISLQGGTSMAPTSFSDKKRSITIDYTPKPIKLSQNISVLYEIK